VEQSIKEVPCFVLKPDTTGGRTALSKFHRASLCHACPATAFLYLKVFKLVVLREVKDDTRLLFDLKRAR
jgi:hypothetical protein